VHMMKGNAATSVKASVISPQSVHKALPGSTSSYSPL
jgi:hypothetical protein